jgi:Flp pilus assembly protein TadG
MSGLSIFRRFSLAAHRFAAAREGNIAMTFAITVLPILGFVGAAIDYSRAANARSSMQAALDSTSLMLSKDLSTGTITQSQIAAKAVSYFTALYTNRDAQGFRSPRSLRDRRQCRQLQFGCELAALGYVRYPTYQY